MSREAELEKEGISLLGNQNVKYPDQYAPEILETFLNKHPGNDYFVKFNCPEFTSLCPITGQPDFATITISYVPGERMVESKSLKLYHERPGPSDGSEIYRGLGQIHSARRHFH